MRILNLYFSSTGNTEKVAQKIADIVQGEGHQVELLKITEDIKVEFFDYDFIFAGSGVYEWLPGQPVMRVFSELRRKYVKAGKLKPASPRIPGKKAVVYCTYGGAHTGVNEAIPAVKYMAQLFDHLGFEILDEWYIVGEYVPEKFKDFNRSGRLGDIRGRPNADDLKAIAERVKGILKV
jgi:Flavodoxins